MYELHKSFLDLLLNFPSMFTVMLCLFVQVGNSVYYNYTLSVNGKLEDHGSDYDKDYLTKIIVNMLLCF